MPLSRLDLVRRCWFLFDSVELLLDRGADAARRNQRDLTPADFAAEAGRDRLAQSLRQRAGARR